MEAQAKAASQAAVKKVISAPLKTEIKGGMEKQVVPDVKSEAMSAAKAQVTVVMNRYNSAINKHLAIPIYGLSTLKSWMESNVKPTAVKEATEKGKLRIKVMRSKVSTSTAKHLVQLVTELLLS